ncbi:hypothetical protein DYB30_003572 [Aphanomyces astaci]|uniref:Uncharacterized protein n=2 Tax=Aphanomyces astaci TaxID=112090 RepID=A0A397E5E8_APHAT|nr:hypothetical protein DYB34_003039 [Aphanomyces astaci]RHY59113.1 hypothetical protein DYB30_003572 [Aphanomyces astaci]RHY73462.1 hypothetical protein DYB38_003662 [Aphanomyces astaci]
MAATPRWQRCTPASLVGDWLTSTVDQNPTSNWDSEAPSFERETVASLAKWFRLPSHTGSFVTGATMSNFVGLAIAREWVGRQRGVQVITDGVAALGPVCIFAGSLHSSIDKAASMLGLGRSCVRVVPTLASREAIDVDALDAALTEACHGTSCIVVASAGTINTGDFDDFQGSRRNIRFGCMWTARLALDSTLAPLVVGMDEANSVCIDCHKWMNVPYDSAVQFTRHQDLQVSVFHNTAVYLGNVAATPKFVHLTPLNSRRWRALAAGFSVVAYGRDGHAEIIRRNVECARLLASQLSELTNQVTVLAEHGAVCRDVKTLAWLQQLTDTCAVFLTPTVVRAAFSNWGTTTAHDIDVSSK